MAISANLGFPRIGAKRELKKAVEAYWKGDLSQEGLKVAAAEIRKTNWEYQKQSGLERHIRTFSRYLPRYAPDIQTIPN
jgi:5-methyltetrahydropteroyltriglutamate--homocysteine methyltransferase